MKLGTMLAAVAALAVAAAAVADDKKELKLPPLDAKEWKELKDKGGLKVYPADVDGVIERFSGAVDVCAFAFEDPLLGEDVGVAVVLRDDAPESTMSELHAWAAEHLAQHQLPRRWYVVPEIPRTSRGKVNRQKVATWCSSQTPVDGSTLRSTEP